jgi:putative transposase
MQASLRDAQRKAGLRWTDIVGVPRKAREDRMPWPTRDALQKHTKGRYRLHSRTVQMICHQLHTNVQATTERSSRRWLRYPYGEKSFVALSGPTQAAGSDTAAKRWWR